MGTPQYTHTRCQVTFHSDNGFDGTLGLEPHPVLGRLVSVQTSKAFGGASGSFSITLKKPQERSGSWAKLFPDPEGTWVRIEWIINGQVQPIMWGMVDSINESVARAEQGARSETYTITGRDFGKAFEDTKTIVNLFAVANLDMFQGLLSAYNLNPPVGSPDVVVKQILELWLGNNGLGAQQYRFPATLKDVAYAENLYEVLNLETIQFMNRGHGETLDMTVLNPDQQSGQALWDVLQQYCNGLINEMWVDLAPRIARTEAGTYKEYGYAPAFYLRERRFRTFEDTSLWDNTRVTELQRADVRQRNLAKGGASNRYNYWVLHGGVLGDQYRTQALTHSLGVEPFKPGAIPIINLESMQRHGIRPYVATTNFLPFFTEGKENQSFLTLAANWMKRIHDWYVVAPYQLSGTLNTSRLRPLIRIGQRVREYREDGPVTYYVEGVDHAWSYPGPGTTTLTLTHGQYDDIDEPLREIYAQYDRQHTVSQAASETVQSDEPQPKGLQKRAPKKGEIIEERDVPKKQPDPQMVGGLGSRDGRHAQKVANRESLDPLPDNEKLQQESEGALDQEALENRVPINRGRS